MDLKCNKCEFSASDKENLRVHFKKLHMEPKPIKCSRCPTGFTTKNALRTHIKTVHNNIKRHKCPRCDFRARYRYQLDKHMKTHENETIELEDNLSDSPNTEQDENEQGNVEI